MKPMKILAMSFVSAMSLGLAGCGGGGSPAAATPYNPNVNGQYANGNQQAYNCQSGMIQLRNAFGQAQCFQTADINQACMQIGGTLAQGNLCRNERQIAGYAHGTFLNNGAMAPDNIPIHLNLFQGEVVKIYGKIDSRDGDAIFWNAQLIQNGVALASASGDTNRVGDIANLSMTATSTANTNQYTQNGNYNYQNGNYQNGNYQNGNYQNGNYQNQYAPTTYPNQYGSVYNQGFYNQPALAVPSQFVLQLQYQGIIRVKVQATAISCQDGRGNSYPCQ
jgi:hypothetical protein